MLRTWVANFTSGDTIILVVSYSISSLVSVLLTNLPFSEYSGEHFGGSASTYVFLSPFGTFITLSGQHMAVSVSRGADSGLVISVSHTKSARPSAYVVSSLSGRLAA